MRIGDCIPGRTGPRKLTRIRLIQAEAGKWIREKILGNMTGSVSAFELKSSLEVLVLSDEEKTYEESAIRIH